MVGISLNVWGMDLVLPQLNMPYFVEFPCEPFPVGRSGLGMGWGERGWDEGWEGNCG